MLLLCIAGAASWRYRRGWAKAADGPLYRRPDPLTPFNVLVLLRRMHADRALDVTAGRHDELGETIEDIQQRFFERSEEEVESSDLTSVVDRWLSRATNGR